MEIVRYEVTYWEKSDSTTQTDAGWAFGSDLADVINQIVGYYGVNNIDTFKIIRMGERDHAVLPDWEIEDFHKSNNVTNS